MELTLRGGDLPNWGVCCSLNLQLGGSAAGQVWGGIFLVQLGGLSFVGGLLDNFLIIFQLPPHG